MIRPYRGVLPRLGARVYVDASAQLIGDVELGDDVSLWPMAVVRGDVNRIRIGARSNVQDGSVLHVTHDGPYSPGGADLRIGEDVTIGHGVILHACRIGSRCLIGMGARVLDEAVIEDEVFIAAGSLVAPGKRLASGFLYRGSPAQQVRALTEREIAQLKYSAEHYVRIKNHYLNSDE
ncbi:MAG TPA: gamma carbonic anhydrase family protein [Nevskia sp.]|jgi:carbonic anhydrase/acetyltransferase-like protein (isoleucine patch superfamily)|nr:gamma carbonic anhydrase family protein [Nevskia sp.]